MFGPPIQRRSDGTYAVDLDRRARALVLSITTQLRDLLTTDSPALQRLFPPPYGDDEERNAGYAALAGAELRDNRLAALGVVERTIDAEQLSQDELEAWMRSVNDIRLVLGTMLGVTEDDHDADPPEELAATWATYEFLGGLLELIVRALAS